MESSLPGVSSDVHNANTTPKLPGNAVLLDESTIAECAAEASCTHARLMSAYATVCKQVGTIDDHDHELH